MVVSHKNTLIALRKSASVIAFACVLASCGRQTQASGSVLVVARVKDAVTLDPAQATDGMSLNVTQEIMRGLVQFKQGTFDVEPAIAKGWAVSPNGRMW